MQSLLIGYGPLVSPVAESVFGALLVGAHSESNLLSTTRSGCDITCDRCPTLVNGWCPLVAGVVGCRSYTCVSGLHWYGCGWFPCSHWLPSGSFSACGSAGCGWRLRHSCVYAAYRTESAYSRPHNSMCGGRGREAPEGSESWVVEKKKDLERSLGLFT